MSFFELWLNWAEFVEDILLSLKSPLKPPGAVENHINVVSKETIEDVQEKSESFKCDLCNYEAKTISSIKRHKSKKHKNISLNLSVAPVLPSKKQPTPCRWCHTQVDVYTDTNTALCTFCKETIEDHFKSSPPLSATLCPCCREPSQGPSTSFCSRCRELLDEGGGVDAGWEVWVVDSLTKQDVFIEP